MSKTLHDTIFELEDATWKALSDSGAKLIPFLSKDCSMLFPMGVKVTATSTPNLKEVMTSESFVPWASYKMSNVEVTELGDDAAIITYRCRAMRPEINAPDDGTPFTALLSTVWRKTEPDAGYLMVLHQQTPFDPSLWSEVEE